MIAEKLKISFDIERIRDYFYTHVKPLEPVRASETFGGWSILSSNGDYRDGFETGKDYVYFDEERNEYVLDYQKAHRETGFVWPEEHVHPTQVCTGYIAEVIQTIQRAGLKPYRARWTNLHPNVCMPWHRDAVQDAYAVRLHIPVITNEDCAFETEEGAFHMPADGSCYLVAVNQLHRAYNKGTTDRIHIIMDVIDTSGISKHHRAPKR